MRPRVYRSPLRDPRSAAPAVTAPRGAEEGNAALVSACDHDANSISFASPPTFVSESRVVSIYACCCLSLSQSFISCRGFTSGMTKHCMYLVLGYPSALLGALPTALWSERSDTYDANNF